MTRYALFGDLLSKENIQSCRIARGSAYELLDHLITCTDQGYLNEGQHEGLKGKLLRFIQLINGYNGSIGRVGNKPATGSVTNDG